MPSLFTKKIELSPPPSNMESTIPQYFLRWFQQVFDRLGTGPFKIQGYILADVPDPTEWGSSGFALNFSSIIYVVNESGGATLAFSNGTNWLRVTDLAPIT